MKGRDRGAEPRRDSAATRPWPGQGREKPVVQANVRENSNLRREPSVREAGTQGGRSSARGRGRSQGLGWCRTTGKDGVARPGTPTLCPACVPTVPTVPTEPLPAVPPSLGKPCHREPGRPAWSRHPLDIPQPVLRIPSPWSRLTGRAGLGHRVTCSAALAPNSTGLASPVMATRGGHSATTRSTARVHAGLEPESSRGGGGAAGRVGGP